MTGVKGGGLGAGGLGRLGLGRPISSTAPPISASVTLRLSGLALKAQATVVPVVPPGQPAMPRVAVEVALTGTIWEGANWVTIAPFIRGLAVTRGRQNELQRAEAGTLTLSLTNQDGRFSPWSKNTPYYNQLPPTDANPTTGEGTWTATNATIGRTTATPRYGQYAWRYIATAAGSITVSSDSRSACKAGRTYNAFAWARAGTTSRLVAVAIIWRDAGGTIIYVSSEGAPQEDTTTWQTTPITVRAVAPTGAVSKDVRVVVATAADGEVHDLGCVGVCDVTFATPAAVTQGWCVGQQSPLTPAQPVRVTATWQGIEYPIFAGAIATWEPKYGTVLATQVIKAYDYMHVLGVMPITGSSYMGLALSDDAVAQWRFGTAAGTTLVQDSSGNDYVGTVSGTMTFNSPGGVPGTSATSVRVPDQDGGHMTATVPQSNAASIEFLIKPSAESTGTQVCVEWGSGSSRVAVSLTASELATTTYVRAIVIGHGTTTTTISGATVVDQTTAWHLITLTRSSAGEFKLYLDGTLKHSVSGAAATGSAVQVGTACGYYQAVTLYPIALTTDEVTAHYSAYTTRFAPELSGVQIGRMLQASGIPSSALGTLDSGQTVCIGPLITQGQTQILSVIQTAENTEQGLFSCNEEGLITFVTSAYVTTSPTTQTSHATIANDDTPAHYHPLAGSVMPSRDDTTLWNYVAIGIQGATTTTTSATFYGQTAASQDRYGMRGLTGYTGMYFETPSQAQQLAGKLCARYAQPRTRVRSISLDSTATAGKNLPQMLGRHLLDAVTVKWQPTDGSTTPFEQVSQIEQVSHIVSPTKWTTTWQLYPFAVNS